MKSSFLAAPALLLSALLVMAGRAEADVYWSSIATACTPGNVAIQDDRYAATPDNYVAPKPGELDPIVLICNVAQKQAAQLPHVLSMTYLDSTGAGASAKVQAQLIRVQRSNGVRAVVATVISNSFPQTTTAYHSSALFSHILNFSTYYYYVRIDIDRNAGSESVRSLGVALESTCGDGVISAPETCDDGGTTSGDGCSATCTVEAGYSCTGSPSVCSPLCGNGALDGAETCDDGDTVNGDGCSATCTVEAGYSCTGSPSVCSPLCGNGAIDGAETCDDGGTVSGDGCSATCTVESGYECSGSPSVCNLLCGNNAIDAGESCDGADLGGETCLSIAGGFVGGTLACTASCTFNTSACIAPVCGDGTINGSEACDDGGTANGDGCSSACAIEANYQCVGQPSVCSPIQHQLAVNIFRTNNGNGTVTSTPAGMNCSTPSTVCTANFTQGTEVTLTATPTGGSVFGGWSGICGGVSTCSVTMSAASAVFATFVGP